MPYADIEKRRAHQREYYQNNKDKWIVSGKWKKSSLVENTKATNRRWYSLNKDHIKETAKLKRELEKQKRFGVCPICGKEDYLVYDHNHVTGIYREYICNSCNLAIGHSFENIKSLQSIIRYLEKHNGR